MPLPEISWAAEPLNVKMFPVLKLKPGEEELFCKSPVMFRLPSNEVDEFMVTSLYPPSAGTENANEVFQTIFPEEEKKTFVDGSFTVKKELLFTTNVPLFVTEVPDEAFKTSLTVKVLPMLIIKSPPDARAISLLIVRSLSIIKFWNEIFNREFGIEPEPDKVPFLTCQNLDVPVIVPLSSVLP